MAVLQRMCAEMQQILRPAQDVSNGSGRPTTLPPWRLNFIMLGSCATALRTCADAAVSRHQARSDVDAGPACACYFWGRRCQRTCRAGSRRRSAASRSDSEIIVTLIQFVAIGTLRRPLQPHPQGVSRRTCRSSRCPSHLPSMRCSPSPASCSHCGGGCRTWFLSLSVVVDIALLMVTIWSFHLQYQAPPAIYFKAPTLMYVFILIALRTLRFEPRFVVLAGVSAAAGLARARGAMRCGLPRAVHRTRDFADYAMSLQHPARRRVRQDRLDP